MTAEEDEDYVEYVSASLERLRRTAFLLCGDAHHADDIVQSALVSVYLRWSKIRTVENLDGYVHRVLVRRYIDESRRSWARVLLAWRIPDMAAKPTASAEDADAVQAALATLSRGQRSVLVLRFICDLSVQETAAALNCSTGNVKSQTSRGLATMRTMLRGQWPATAGSEPLQKESEPLQKESEPLQEEFEPLQEVGNP